MFTSFKNTRSCEKGKTREHSFPHGTKARRQSKLETDILYETANIEAKQKRLQRS